ncbi:hypothetical protein P692DRAFT_201811512 [Suillus brevipes Sb2]|nr:hypothetical protein P692DRAFT_201811512 [Suillus brevipes Sb2]
MTPFIPVTYWFGHVVLCDKPEGKVEKGCWTVGARELEERASKTLSQSSAPPTTLSLPSDRTPPTTLPRPPTRPRQFYSTLLPLCPTGGRGRLTSRTTSWELGRGRRHHVTLSVKGTPVASRAPAAVLRGYVPSGANALKNNNPTSTLELPSPTQLPFPLLLRRGSHPLGGPYSRYYRPTLSSTPLVAFFRVLGLKGENSEAVYHSSSRGGV